MKVFYFSKEIKRAVDNYGDFREKFFTTSADLISYANDLLEENADKQLTKKEIRSIVSEELPDFDFYAVQCWCDGFGNDTYTAVICKTYEKAKAYIEEHWGEHKDDFAIVGQWFDRNYINKWES